MKQLQKSDLIKGEIYTSKSNSDPNDLFIWMCSDNNELNYSSRLYVSDINTEYGQLSLTNLSHSWSNIFKSTPEEKHWLETCIKENKFVSYEEAMKTFIPEYVECIEKNVHDYGTNVIGKIYKTICYTNSDYLIECDGKKYPSVSKHRFKPSTKEAYDAQFVVKEPEFVLPENWMVKIDDNNRDFFQKERGGKLYHGFISSGHYPGSHKWAGGLWCEFNHFNKYTKITFEQFKKYVLKEDVEVLEEPKDKILAHFIQSGKTTIQSVECSEGGIYRIGDKITPFDKDSPNKGKSFTIIGFRWNTAKTEICAITDAHQPYGIRLSQIELYIEPKKELSLLEQAKLRYPIGTKYIPTLRFSSKTSEISNGLFIESRNFISNAVNHTSIYNKNIGKWAEIVDDFVLPKKWCIKDVKEVKHFFENYNHGGYSCINNAYLHYPRIGDRCYFKTIQKDYTEITLEQFKKYVLK